MLRIELMNAPEREILRNQSAGHDNEIAGGCAGI